MAIDLHTHTTASDGTLSPAALVDYARTKGLEALAITDHDTVGGLAEAIAAAARTGFEVVPGVEISAEYPRGTLHILGYYIDFNNTDFLAQLSVLQDARAERNPKIVAKLREQGIDITLEEIEREAETGLVGRPHFAQVLVKKGYVKDAQQAFDRYLKKGSPAYVEKFRFEVKAAIRMIARAGGIPVLGHPVTLNCSTLQLETEIAAWKDLGLQGLEVYYAEHDAVQTRLYAELARRYGLVATGGSDFHGNMIKGVELGSGRGSLRIPYSVLDELKKKKERATASPQGAA
jgi:3',5'-nucleoside bisphosphate phosphatase